MKVCVIQPAYSTEYSKSDEFFKRQLTLLDECDASMDIIVMPECCDIPCLAATDAQRCASVEKYNARLLEKVASTARRCSALVFANAGFKAEGGWRNTTYAFDRRGNVEGMYFKQHLTPKERKYPEGDVGYSLEFSEPLILEIEGIRFAFLTCYDFYFYENFSNIAVKRPDIIIGCSHQRSDSHDALELITRFLAYNTNAYVLRSSVSMDEASDIGGASMVVAPDGRVLANMHSRVGLGIAEIDLKDKFYKPAGFGNPPAAHFEYIEQGRCPYKYRPAGSGVVPTDAEMPYPRMCAHRGFNTIAPENSMPAFGAAVAMGAQEIEFDLWCTKDGEVVSIHDDTLDRVSDGTGKVYEHTYAELLRCDFGMKYGEKFRGMKILRFEEILEKFSCRAIMNIHVKTAGNDCEYDPAALEKIVRLIDKYGCRDHVYFMSGNDNFLRLAREMAPDICRCCGGGDRPWDIVERAMEYGCKKVQLFKPYFNQAMIDKAHANGIKCNVFWSDDPAEARKFLEMGIDTILTNDYNLVSQVL